MKKTLIFCLVLLLLAMMPLAAFATETEETEPPLRQPGQCGEEITWKLEGDTLTISGNGKMDDFPEAAPWAEHKSAITKVVFMGNISYIGTNAFRDYDSLKEVDFGDAIYEIGAGAFYSCDGLTKIELPDTFKVFGEESFRSCPELKEIHCSGRFPSFRLNCLWDTYTKIYFPAERPWPVDLIQQLEEAFKGRIEFLASDGSDPYVPTEPTEPTQAAEPEVTTEPQTEPTQPAQTPADPVETEPAQTQTETTESVETEPSETQQETSEPAEVPGEESGTKEMWKMIAVVSGTVVLVMAVVIIYLLLSLRKGSGGKYASK